MVKFSNDGGSTIEINFIGGGEHLLKIQNALILGIEVLGSHEHSGYEDHQEAVWVLSSLLKHCMLDESQTNIALGGTSYVKPKKKRHDNDSQFHDSMNEVKAESYDVTQFWKDIELLFDMGKVRLGYDIVLSTIPTLAGIDIKEEGTVKKKYFDSTTRVLLVRFSNLYNAYAEFNQLRGRFTRVMASHRQSEENILMNLKEQGYFVGLAPTETFNDKRTSAYVFNFDEMESLGIMRKINSATEPKQETTARQALAS